MNDKDFDNTLDNLNVVRLRAIVKEWNRAPGHNFSVSVGFLRDLLHVMDKQDMRIRELTEDADNEG